MYQIEAFNNGSQKPCSLPLLTEKHTKSSFKEHAIFRGKRTATKGVAICSGGISLFHNSSSKLTQGTDDVDFVSKKKLEHTKSSQHTKLFDHGESTKDVPKSRKIGKIDKSCSSSLFSSKQVKQKVASKVVESSKEASVSNKKLDKKSRNLNDHSIKISKRTPTGISSLNKSHKVKNDVEKNCTNSLELPIGNTEELDGNVSKSKSARTKAFRTRKVNCNTSVFGTSCSVLPNTNDTNDDIIKISENTTTDITSNRTKSDKRRKIDHKNETIGILPLFDKEARQKLFPSKVTCQSNDTKGMHLEEAVSTACLKVTKQPAEVFLSFQNSKDFLFSWNIMMLQFQNLPMINCQKEMLVERKRTFVKAAKLNRHS